MLSSEKVFFKILLLIKNEMLRKPNITILESMSKNLYAEIKQKITYSSVYLEVH